MGLIPSHDEHAPSELLGEDPYKEFDAPEPPAKSDLTCAVCGEQTKLNCPCGTVAYCSKSCQKSDWREGHKKVCKARREGHKKEAADAAASAPAFGHYIQTPEDKYVFGVREAFHSPPDPHRRCHGVREAPHRTGTRTSRNTATAISARSASTTGSTSTPLRGSRGPCCRAAAAARRVTSAARRSGASRARSAGSPGRRRTR